MAVICLRHVRCLPNVKDDHCLSYGPMGQRLSQLISILWNRLINFLTPIF